MVSMSSNKLRRGSRNAKLRRVAGSLNSATSARQESPRWRLTWWPSSGLSFHTRPSSPIPIHGSRCSNLPSDGLNFVNVELYSALSRSSPPRPLLSLLSPTRSPRHPSAAGQDTIHFSSIGRTSGHLVPDSHCRGRTTALSRPLWSNCRAIWCSIEGGRVCYL